MRESWLTPQWRGRRRIAHPVNWARLPEYDIGVAFVQARVDHGHENRWYLYIRKFNEADVKAFPVLASTVITSSPGSTQTITSDATWNNGANTVECIGAGARGAIGSGTSASGAGAGGGAYTKITNASIPTPGTDQYFAQVGGTTATNGSAGGDTWWTLTSPGTSFPVSGTAAGAKGGAALASATTATGGTGGASASGYPSSGSVRTSGGGGGNGSGISAAAGGGGGGAGGASGDGISVAGAGPSTGGAGNFNAGGGGTGGTIGNGAGAVGGNGTNIQTGPNVGSGGGGGGGNISGSIGGAGGLYGGGGGGGGRSTGTGGQGAQGVIVLTWTPIFTGTLGATEATDAAAFPSGKVAWAAILNTLEGTPYAMLLHFDGANASTTIVDSGGKNQVVTAHGAAQIDTSLLVFSNSALKLTTGGDYLDVGLHPDLVLGSSDFTVDFRARLSSGSTPQTFYEGGPANFKIYYDGTALKFTSAAGTITGGALASNTNYHIAVTRAAGSVRLFLDGVQVGSTLTDAAFYTTSFGYPQIGDGVAVVSGALAVTEANDTPAFTGTAAFPAVTGTLVTTEASDVSALAATVRWNAILAATEASDVSALTGTVVTAPTYDSATNAWIAAVGAGNVDATHAGYVDTLIRALKTDGIWTKLDRLWILAAQNTNSALVDLKALDLGTATNSPTFTANRGYAGNGSSSYIDTTFNPSTQAVQFTLDDAHLAVWDNTNRAAATTVAVGTYDGTAEADLFPYQAVFSATGVGCRINLAAADPASIAYNSSLGLFIGQSISHTTQEMSVNGTSIGTFPKTYGGYIVNFPFFVCGENAGGGLGTPSTDQICMVSMGATLTRSEASRFYYNLNSYMASVGVPSATAIIDSDSAVDGWIRYVVAAGGSVSSGRQTLVHNLVTGLKADGVWAKLDRLWLFAGENSQSALIDLKALAAATATNSPTFTTDRGFTCNASSYVDTGYNPATVGVQYTLNSAHIACWSLTSAQSNQFTAFAGTSGPQTNLFVRYVDDNYYVRINNNSAGNGPNTDGSGFFMGIRTAASGAGCIMGYRNGVNIVSTADGSNFLDSGNLIANDRQLAAIGAGASMNGTEQGNFYSRLRTYMTAVGVP